MESFKVIHRDRDYAYVKMERGLVQAFPWETYNTYFETLPKNMCKFNNYWDPRFDKAFELIGKINEIHTSIKDPNNIEYLNKYIVISCICDQILEIIKQTTFAETFPFYTKFTHVLNLENEANQQINFLAPPRPRRQRQNQQPINPAYTDIDVLNALKAQLEAMATENN